VKISCKYDDRGFSKSLKRVQDQVDKMLEQEIAVAARDTSKQAKSYVPVDQSNLKNSIKTEIKGKTGWVGTRTQYGPYVEFGTGLLVSVPGELQDYAMQFKGKGVREINNYARPYLFPAFFIVRERFIERTDRRTAEIFKNNSKR